MATTEANSVLERRRLDHLVPFPAQDTFFGDLERVVATWVPLHYYEALAAQPGELPIKQARFVQERLHLAQRRYLAAIKALATVRRLTLSAPLPAVLTNANAAGTSAETSEAVLLRLAESTKRSQRAAGR